MIRFHFSLLMIITSIGMHYKLLFTSFQTSMPVQIE